MTEALPSSSCARRLREEVDGRVPHDVDVVVGLGREEGGSWEEGGTEEEEGSAAVVREVGIRNGRAIFIVRIPEEVEEEAETAGPSFSTDPPASSVFNFTAHSQSPPPMPS